MAESMGFLKRTDMCGSLRKEHVGKKVTLMGWVHRRRDHGGLIFIDLRDREGIVQIVFSPQVSLEAFKKAESVRSEYVLAVVGEVRLRPEGTINEKLSTGEVEVYADQLIILNEAKTPPFVIEESEEVEEAVRLKYRYLDLRRPELQRIIILRHRITKSIRDYLDRAGFLEIETPMLTRSTPEGARDYLVPSRVHPGEFYALPQSPQLFKQILMISGFDRYFQIVRCFRDEDLRADRQPEFTQLDMEMSFVNEEDIIEVVEGLMSYIFKENLGISLNIPFPRITYEEAVNKFGTDRPDLRFDLELVDISDAVVKSDFKVFSDTVRRGGQVKGINARGCGSYSRKDIDGLTDFVKGFGAKGLAWFIITEDGIKSPIAKFFTQQQLDDIVEKMKGEKGDLLLFVADEPKIVAESLGNLRLELAKRMNLIDKNKYEFVWITDFPLVEYDEEEKRWDSKHHPFTSPKEEDIKFLEQDPSKVKARAYDLILNGIEIGGGSIRISDRELQQKIFKILGLSSDEVKEKFGFLLEAFEYGAPPHGGIAFGLDRLVMLMAGRDTIRDCIAFPKTQSASCLMTQAPSKVSEKQLRELGIKFC
ncbi:MAG: Aspartate--tRNA ligase [Clostridia bacterium 41_269]|nr:MAG: Aspartate--tRNA ligase [Clostridia bacterium 41_269]